MKILQFVVLSLCFYFVFSFSPAAADFSVGLGPEYFLWREFNSNGLQALEESGIRSDIGVSWKQHADHGFLIGYTGKLYFGQVSYNGQTLFPPYQPVTTNTIYEGIQNEGLLIFRKPIEDLASLDLVTSFGWDHWTRNINPGNSNQLEDYDILYVKIGPVFTFLEGQKPWIGLGIKYPVSTFENAHITDLGFDQNPILHPGREPSFYLSMGCQFIANWEGEVYYDSYRFSESPRENVTSTVFSSGVVYQPQSNMDLFGIRAVYRFP